MMRLLPSDAMVKPSRRILGTARAGDEPIPVAAVVAVVASTVRRLTTIPLGACGVDRGGWSGTGFYVAEEVGRLAVTGSFAGFRGKAPVGRHATWLRRRPY